MLTESFRMILLKLMFTNQTLILLPVVPWVRAHCFEKSTSSDSLLLLLLLVLFFVCCTISHCNCLFCFSICSGERTTKTKKKDDFVFPKINSFSRTTTIASSMFLSLRKLYTNETHIDEKKTYAPKSTLKSIWWSFDWSDSQLCSISNWRIYRHWKCKVLEK